MLTNNYSNPNNYPQTNFRSLYIPQCLKSSIKSEIKTGSKILKKLYKSQKENPFHVKLIYDNGKNEWIGEVAEHRIENDKNMPIIDFINDLCQRATELKRILTDLLNKEKDKHLPYFRQR